MYLLFLVFIVVLMLINCILLVMLSAKLAPSAQMSVSAEIRDPYRTVMAKNQKITFFFE
jgi:hypothetical protein